LNLFNHVTHINQYALLNGESAGRILHYYTHINLIENPEVCKVKWIYIVLNKESLCFVCGKTFYIWFYFWAIRALTERMTLLMSLRAFIIQVLFTLLENHCAITKIPFTISSIAKFYGKIKYIS